MKTTADVLRDAYHDRREACLLSWALALMLLVILVAWMTLDLTHTSVVATYVAFPLASYSLGSSINTILRCRRLIWQIESSQDRIRKRKV